MIFKAYYNENKYWKIILDNLIFSIHLDKISLINTEKMKEKDLESILNEVINRHAYNEKKTKYIVGFPCDNVTHDSSVAKGSIDNTPI